MILRLLSDHSSYWYIYYTLVRVYINTTYCALTITKEDNISMIRTSNQSRNNKHIKKYLCYIQKYSLNNRILSCALPHFFFITCFWITLHRVERYLTFVFFISFRFCTLQRRHKIYSCAQTFHSATVPLKEQRISWFVEVSLSLPTNSSKTAVTLDDVVKERSPISEVGVGIGLFVKFSSKTRP